MTELKTQSVFEQDVDAGFSLVRKSISSRYFYDSKGDHLFRQIMEMPEYYPTSCEYEILSTYKDEIWQLLGTKTFDIIEFGAGDAYKTRILLKHFLQKGSTLSYIPIDISGNVLEKLKKDLNDEMPSLEVNPIVDEYFSALQQLKERTEKPKLVIFLGSNIGNFTKTEAIDFISRIYSHLNSGDLLLLGVDLKKDPAIILNAYNDQAGITASFNMNLLHRINRELGADFITDQFYHYPVYDPSTGTAKSFLVSKEDQDVSIPILGKTFHFWKGEEIATEISQKYELSQLKKWGTQLNFTLAGLYMDRRLFFTDIVFRK